MQRRGLRVAQREVAVAPQLAAEEEHVPRAVHRLDRVGVLVVDRDQEHVLAELLPVPRRLPERLVVDERRLAPRSSRGARSRARRRSSSTLKIAIPFGCQNGEPGECSSKWKRSSCWPSRRWSLRARLLEPREIRVEVGLREERRPVDPCQLRVLLVAAPVRAGEARQLERLDRLRVLQVRAAAEVGEVALGVERDVALGACRRARPCTARPPPRSGRARRRGRSPRAPRRAPRRARAGPPPRSRRGRSSRIGSGNSKS